MRGQVKLPVEAFEVESSPAACLITAATASGCET